MSTEEALEEAQLLLLRKGINLKAKDERTLRSMAKMTLKEAVEKAREMLRSGYEPYLSLKEEEAILKLIECAETLCPAEQENG